MDPNDGIYSVSYIADDERHERKVMLYSTAVITAQQLSSEPTVRDVELWTFHGTRLVSRWKNGEACSA